MATIVNNPAPERLVAVESSGSTAGWGVAVILLLAVIGGGIYWWMQYSVDSAQSSNTPSNTNINVTLPAPTTDKVTPAP